MKIILPFEDSDISKIFWLKLDQQYKDSLVSNGFSDIIFSIFIKE